MFKKFISTGISQFLRTSISHERLQICPRILYNSMLRKIYITDDEVGINLIFSLKLLNFSSHLKNIFHIREL